MSRTDRNSKRRSLLFEHLEGKTSPTGLFVGVAWHVGAAVAEVSIEDGQSADRFLQYVAMLKEISVRRSLPTEADTLAVDGMIASTSPDPFH